MESFGAESCERIQHLMSDLSSKFDSPAFINNQRVSVSNTDSDLHVFPNRNYHNLDICSKHIKNPEKNLNKNSKFSIKNKLLNLKERASYKAKNFKMCSNLTSISKEKDYGLKQERLKDL